MAILLFFLALIVRAENKSVSFVHGDSLVGSVEDNLDTCTEIVKLVDDFTDVYHHLHDLRRLDEGGDILDDEKLVEGVERKLGECTDIVKAVHNFGHEYNAIGGHELDNDGTAPIVLNVGGTHFATKLATLMSAKGSIFEKMLSKESNFTIGSDGAYFIDRDPGTFAYIMDYLRDGDLFIKNDDEYLRGRLLADAEYYELPQEVKEYLKWMSIRPMGIDLMLSEVTFLNKQLKSVSRKLGDILYRASVDGDSYTAFHNRCDNKGPTVVIVETEYGNVFGGYTYTSWSSSSGAYAASTGSFLFRLRPSMKRYDIKSGREAYAIYRRNIYPPIFGAGHELYIASGGRSSTSSYTANGGNTYNIGTYELNDGVKNFRVHDYIVVHANSL